jgi:hypothetical protein
MITFRLRCQQIIADPTDPLRVHAQPGNMVLMAFSQNTTDASDAARPASHAVQVAAYQASSAVRFLCILKLTKVVSTEQGNIRHIMNEMMRYKHTDVPCLGTVESRCSGL